MFDNVDYFVFQIVNFVFGNLVRQGKLMYTRTLKGKIQNENTAAFHDIYIKDVIMKNQMHFNFDYIHK